MKFLFKALSLLFIVQISAEKMNTDVILLSFPRSGNTWMRYSLEFLTKRPSWQPLNFGVDPNWRDDYLNQWIKCLNQWEKHNQANAPIGLIYDFDINLCNPFILKVHEYVPSMGNQLPMILLIRNYKECLSRHFALYGKKLLKLVNESCLYFENLKAFDLYSNRKILVYYEDLITNPKKVYREILDFFGDSDEYLDSFMANFQMHKKRAIHLYEMFISTSKTKGENLHYHSEKIPREILLEMDEIVRNKYPKLWSKYLCRYEEN